MSTGTEIAPTKPRSPSRKVRKRDERVRRVVRKIRKHATCLDQPHFATLLYTYGAVWVRFVDLNSVKAEPVDELGRAEHDHRPAHVRRGVSGNSPRNLVFRRAPSARCAMMRPSRPLIVSGSC